MVETRGEDDTTGILNLDFFDSEFFDYLDGAELHFPGFMEEEEDHVIGGTTIPSETKFIENLPLHSLTRDDIGKINVCAVCMDEFIVEEKVTFLPCLHYFHGNCVLPWLNIHNTCPLCRFEFPT
ncbi:hypothetical protein MKW94_002020 [Papaver nudicaule]|uniref:RING-type E3 ubiquitin transferase n=1 Tax=Papaver nudicaule TaxID=74823 RepID=A0AA41VA29_PAPNU|nr:hypothetical protein [Papaver nudicaule]